MDITTLQQTYDGVIPEPLRQVALHGSTEMVALVEVEGRAAFYTAQARQYWQQWDEEHRELGLYALEERVASAWRAADDVESLIDATPATSVAGAIAKLRYALAHVRNDAKPEDQPNEARAITDALAFLSQTNAA